jgi:hypothetical protein
MISTLRFAVPAVLALLGGLLLAGCSRAPAKVDQPIRYNSHSELKSRLLEVSQYGDGGSSLGGIPESIDALTKDDPETGKLLQADFQKLNTSNSKEERKKIAKEMAERIK